MDYECGSALVNSFMYSLYHGSGNTLTGLVGPGPDKTDPWLAVGAGAPNGMPGMPNRLNPNPTLNRHVRHSGRWELWAVPRLASSAVITAGVRSAADQMGLVNGMGCGRFRISGSDVEFLDRVTTF